MLMKSNNYLRDAAKVLAVSAFVFSSAAALPAYAATVSFTDVKGAWSNPQGNSATYANNNTDNAQVRWGTPVGGSKSGYNFVGYDIGPVTVVDGESSAPVTIGAFEHVNFPIEAGTSISGIDLKFTANVWIDGTDLGAHSFLYNFSHFETPNSAAPCANGGAEGQGVNVNGCADRVTMNFNASSSTFMIGGDQYTLDLVGFLVGGDPTTGFWTVENSNNKAYLEGKVNLYSRAIGGAVPEPATWAMMIIGFGATGAMVRNRRRVLQTA
jgi:hypothetical protein